jgi:hypothetical protein
MLKDARLVLDIDVTARKLNPCTKMIRVDYFILRIQRGLERNILEIESHTSCLLDIRLTSLGQQAVYRNLWYSETRL